MHSYLCGCGRIAGRVRDILRLMVATRATLPDLNPLDQDALKAILLATHERTHREHEEMIAARSSYSSKKSSYSRASTRSNI